MASLSCTRNRMNASAVFVGVLSAPLVIGALAQPVSLPKPTGRTSRNLNDFFPFNRAELKTAEPDIYKLMVEVWGPIQAGGLVANR